MDKNQIIEKLNRINLNLDSETIRSVLAYLFDEIGLWTDIQTDYQIFAAVAIVSETQTFPTISQYSSSKNGIKIQNVMSHLQKLSKEKFLDTLTRQLQKQKKPPQHLKKKVQDIRFSYRFYKKYQTTFEALYTKLSLNCNCKEQFSAFFWVVFLYLKNTHIQTQNLTESKTLLILLFRIIFQRYLATKNFNDILAIMQENIGQISKIKNQKFEYYFGLVEQKISFFYSKRFPETLVNFDKLRGNYSYVYRLLDDISNAYVKEQSQLRYFNDIDELSYLQLKKNLTPQVFKKTIAVQQIQLITTTLNFDDSDQDSSSSFSGEQPIKAILNFIQYEKDECPTTKNGYLTQKNFYQNRKQPIEPEPIIKAFKLPPNKGQFTPISRKLQNQSWMNSRIHQVTLEKINFFLNMFDHKQSQMTDQPQKSFKQKIKSQILQLIKDFTPKCANLDQRLTKILSYIVTNMNQLSQKSQLFKKIVSNEENQQKIIGIASFSCEIFNYINNSISYEYKHHCQTLLITTKIAFSALQLFRNFLIDSMPIDVKQYVLNTIKRFLIADIWENSEGYKILCQNSQPQFAHIRDKIILEKQKRIKEICRVTKIQSKIQKKTQNMMNVILQKKPYLLKSNNIDQIILCCLMSCLSINEKQQQHTLELLFCSYNTNIKFAFNSNQQGLRDNYGKEMKIVDYYNQVFLNQIKDILLEQQDQLDDFLLTPVRLTSKYLGSNIEKNIQKKKQLTGTFLFNSQKGVKPVAYRQNLIKRSLSMKQSEQEEDQDLPSPSFGMKKTITFAKADSSNQ